MKTMTPELPQVEVDQRFRIAGLDRLPRVELIRKLPTTWVVAAILPDGSVDRAQFRVSRDSLTGKTVQILPADSRPELSMDSVQLLPSAPNALALANTRLLTAEEFHRLKDVPPEAEWFPTFRTPRPGARIKTISEASWNSLAHSGPRSSGL